MMPLLAYLFARLQTHQHQLAVFSGIKHSPIIGILHSRFFNICYISFHICFYLFYYAAIISHRGMKAKSEFTIPVKVCLLSPDIIFIFKQSGGGVCWTKFECFSSKIQMIKNTNADEARRNYLSGGMDSPCLGCFPARRRGLGRNAGGI